MKGAVGLIIISGAMHGGAGGYINPWWIVGIVAVFVGICIAAAYFTGGK